jgi:hypothetical protein
MRALESLVAKAESRVGKPMYDAQGKPVYDARGEHMKYVSGYATADTAIGVVSVTLQRVAGCSQTRRHWRETWEVDGKRIAKDKLAVRLSQ